MTKQNYTHLIMVVDSSGSMASLEDEVIGGVKQFVKEQGEQPGEATVSLYQFPANPFFPGNRQFAQEVAMLKTYDHYWEKFAFEVSGLTPLCDSVCAAIKKEGMYLAELKEEERPSKVIFTIFTDGGENASRTYGVSTMAEMIKHQTETYGWEFIFVGANQDAIGVAKQYNIPAANAVQWQHDPQGTAVAYAATSAINTRIRNT